MVGFVLVAMTLLVSGSIYSGLSMRSASTTVNKTPLRRRVDACPELSRQVSDAARKGKLDGLRLVIDGKSYELRRDPPTRHSLPLTSRK